MGARMPQAITEFWGEIAGGWKVALVLAAMFSALATFIANTQDFRALPQKVQSLETTVETNTTSLRNLRNDADALSGRLDRILCYLEADATGANALGCSR